jgi:hypothetical protein
MSLETMTKISTVTVGAGGSASISFSNIPQGYTDLVLKLSTRTTASGWTTTGLVLTLNGSSASVYSRRTLYNTSAGSAGSDSTSSTTSFIGGIVSCGASATSNTFGTANIYIPNYSDFNNKNISVESVSENNGTDTAQTYTFGLFANSSPITSLTLIDANGGSFVQHSMATLYGVKDTIKTAGNSIKATGGNIVFDGTYVYHVFNSTGAFTPSQPVVADALVVAGGGGGGYSASGGGGGAGGLVWSPSKSLSPSSYTVTVGAGGAGSVSRDAQATSGVTSYFSGVGIDTITANGGGGSGSGNSSGVNGGSGGGGGGARDVNTSGGSATTGSGGTAYGNAGGGGNGTGPGVYGGGGGGGAGAAGVSARANTSFAGAGGVGLTYTTIPSLDSIGLATGAGQLVDGHYYFAGGGGGGADGGNQSTAGAGGYGGGGTGTATDTPAQAGMANTGGGAGGGGRSSVGSTSVAGGSGIVIIRYKG